jgi:hypothetical protein
MEHPADVATPTAGHKTSTSGRAFTHALRGLSRNERADLAINGVPTLGAPFTDSQLASLFRVSRNALKAARARAKPAPSLKDYVRTLTRAYGAGRVWDALVEVVNEGR